jgi:uncharacterized membrane protein (UPF0127 family)
MRTNPKTKQYIILGLLIAVIPMVLGIIVNQTVTQNIYNQNIPEEIPDKPNPDWSDTEISIMSIETDNDSITVTVSINGPADHWRIILDEEFPIGEANSIEGQGVATATTQYTFYSIPPGDHIVRVAAVTPSHQLAGEIASQSFTIEEKTDGKFIIINNKPFLIFRAFIVEQLNEEDFIGLYESLEKNDVVLFTFGRSVWHEYFNDHVTTGTDVIWLNAKYKIVLLESVEYCENADQMNYLERLEKCHISRTEAKYLIEARSGFIEENDIKLNDIVEINLFNDQAEPAASFLLSP